MQILNNTRKSAKKAVRRRKKSGRKLSLKKVDGYLSFLLFLGMIGLVYIWNSHLAERQIRHKLSLEKEVKELKSTFLMKQSSLTSATRVGEVTSIADSLGLRMLERPAYQLVRDDGSEEVDRELEMKMLRRELEKQRPPSGFKRKEKDSTKTETIKTDTLATTP